MRMLPHPWPSGVAGLSREEGQTYDWFMGYDRLKDTLKPLLQPEFKICMVGCGNSSTSAAPAVGRDRWECG